METTKKETPELLKNLDGTAKDFTAEHENGDLKAVGLGGEFVNNENGGLVVSHCGNDTVGAFQSLPFDDFEDLFHFICNSATEHLFFGDAIVFNDNKENKGIEYKNDSKSISSMTIGDISNVFIPSAILISWIDGFERPLKHTLISHIISILSQKDVDCIDLVGLDSGLLEHIESLFKEVSIYFEDDESEKVHKGRVIYSEYNKNYKGRAIVMIDDVISCIDEGYVKEVGREKERVTVGWTW